MPRPDYHINIVLIHFFHKKNIGKISPPPGVPGLLRRNTTGRFLIIMRQGILGGNHNTICIIPRRTTTTRKLQGRIDDTLLTLGGRIVALPFVILLHDAKLIRMLALIILGTDGGEVTRPGIEQAALAGALVGGAVAIGRRLERLEPLELGEEGFDTRGADDDDGD